MVRAQPFQGTETLPNIDVHLLGRRITCMTAPAIVNVIHQACTERRKIVVAHYNVHGFNLSMQLPWFYSFLQSADITHCDGTGILKAIQYTGLKLPIQYRVSYTTLMPKLLEHSDRNGFSIFLLGSRPENLQRALKRLRSNYPNVDFGGHDGYFSMQDPLQNAAVISQINQMRPHILLVGMGMPLQEQWISQHRNRLNANAILPCGAAIDRLAGVVSDCPALLSNLGLEWFYRLLKEPKRLGARYLLGNPAFVLQIMLAKAMVQPQDVLEIRPKEIQRQQFSYLR